MTVRIALVGLLIAGSALPALAVDCSTIPGNLVTSCGFESAGEVAAWSPNGGTPTFAAGQGENGGAVHGASQLFSTTHVFSIKSPCFAVTPGEQLSLGYSVRLFSGTAPNCTAGYQEYSDGACVTATSGSIGSTVTVPSSAGYSPVTGTRTVSGVGNSMQLDLDCRTDSGAFEVLDDNAFATVQVTPLTAVPALGRGALALLALTLAGVAALFLRR